MLKYFGTLPTHTVTHTRHAIASSALFLLLLQALYSPTTRTPDSIRPTCLQYDPDPAPRPRHQPLQSHWRRRRRHHRQGGVQGRRGLLLGSVIPCALFYFLQLYLKRYLSNPNPNPNQPTPSPESESEHAGQPVELPVLPRSVSRTLLAPRCARGPVYVSGQANSVLKGGQSPYDVGLRKVAEDPYDVLSNPNGFIQLGLDENKLSLDLVGDWFLENAKEAILGGGELGICRIACYQPLDGLMMD